MLRLLLLVNLSTIQAGGQQRENPIEQQYTKGEVLIPMRDGKRLFTHIYSPKDTSQKYPILMQRTPYGTGPYGADRFRRNLGPDPTFATDKYIFVYQDVRGRYMSEGTHVFSPPIKPKKGPKDFDESTDAYDSISWLMRNVPNHNGRVGMWGVSQPGFYAAASLIHSHPALVAVSPQAPVADRFVGDDDHHNGAFFLAQRYSFMSGFGVPRPVPVPAYPQTFAYRTTDIYDYFLKMGPLSNAQKHFKNSNRFWNHDMEHDTYDQFWRSRNLPQHLKRVKPAVFTVGGWFDAENLYGAIATYSAIERQSKGSRNYFMMGPWSHGGFGGSGESLGSIHFGAKTGDEFRKHQKDFFTTLLKGDGKLDLPESRMFVTGTNEWRSFAKWPPFTKRSALWLDDNNTIKMGSAPAKDGKAFDEYVSDPAKPVPFLPNAVASVPGSFMTADQRFAAIRPDVLVFETEPLKRDVTLAGPMAAKLFVSTTGTDSDWIVKVIDVYPANAAADERIQPPVQLANYQMLVRWEVMRGKFRNSLQKPEPFRPGRPTAVNFTLNDLLHTFKKGHKIMVQVQSSMFPLIDRNPQKFTKVTTARAEDFQRATQRIYHSKRFPSRIEVGILP